MELQKIKKLLTENWKAILIASGIGLIIILLIYAVKKIFQPKEWFCIKCETKKKTERFWIFISPNLGICYNCLATNFSTHMLQQVKNAVELDSQEEK